MQASQSKSYSAGLERKLRSNQQYLANLESRLQHEIVKAAPLMGSNLDALPTAQLQQLVHAQEEALKRARSMLVRTARAAFTCLHSQSELCCHEQSGKTLQAICIIVSCMLQHSICCSQSAPCSAWALMVALVSVPSMCPCLCLLYCVLNQCQLCRHAGTLRKVQQLLPQPQRML